MCDCWEAHPRDRPTFTEIRQWLEAILEQLSPADYLSLTMDEAQDYQSSESESDDSVVYNPSRDDIGCPRSARSVSESTHGDSGLGEKNSTDTSRVTLHSCVDGTDTTSWLAVDVLDEATPCAIAVRSTSTESVPFDMMASHQPGETTEKGTTDEIAMETIQRGFHKKSCSPSKKKHLSPRQINTGLSSSFPILNLRLEHGESRLSTSSVSQLLGSDGADTTASGSGSIV